MMKHRKLILGSLFILWVIFLAAAGTFLYYGYKAARYYRDHQSFFEGDYFIKYDPKLGYRQKTGAAARKVSPLEYDIFTDNLGFRADSPVEVFPDQADVLVVGCSYTWGDGVQNESTYPNLLAKAAGLTVANAAVPGYGTTQSVLSVETYGFLNPKTVIYGYIPDHDNRNVEPCAPSESRYCYSAPYVDFDAAGNPALNDNPKPYPKALFRYFDKVFRPHPFGLRDILAAMERDYIDTTALARKDKWTPEHYSSAEIQEAREKATLFLLDRLLEKNRKLGAKTVFLYMPHVQDIHPPQEYLKDYVEKRSREGDFFFVDMTPVFLEAVARDGEHALKAGGFDGHPNEKAHRLIADALRGQSPLGTDLRAQ